MLFDKVLLVAPYAPGRFFGGVRPPVGIGYIEEFLNVSGIKTSMLDMTVGSGVNQIIRRIKRDNCKLVGFTIMTYQYRHSFSLIARLKRALPEIKIVVGGPHICVCAESAMRTFPEVDYAISGEGEIAMKKLCAGEDPANIPGMHYRSGSAIAISGVASVIEDLDMLPFPRYRSLDVRNYTDEIEISTSRGCPHKCIFCTVNSILGNHIRYRSAASVLDELEYWYERGIRKFQFGDDNLIANHARLTEICDGIKMRHLTGLVLRCGQGIRADLLTRQVLETMRAAGFKHLGIGVESSSDKVLQALKKGTTIAKIEAGVSLACEMGFDVTLLFVIGSPGETFRDIEDSIKFAKKYPVMKAFFFNLIPFPGTELFEWVNKNKLLLAPYDELINRADELKLRSKPFFYTKELSEKERIRALKITERVSKDIQVNTIKRKLSRFGPIAGLLSQVGRFDAFERLFVRNRIFRKITDLFFFG